MPTAANHRILLAPMEGVVEHHVRDILTRIGGLDACVTEFIRVTDQVLPKKVFLKFAPELQSHSKTPNGVLVKAQLLGSNPEMLAQNALALVNLGAKAIDLNFGCPAKTVNSHQGGACLLQTPDLVFQIVKSVRDNLPTEIPVSAKIRLGYEDRSTYLDNAIAIESAGANEICVHARSKVDGYKPPAYWHYIADIKKRVRIPVIANGEIWTLDDYLRCREESQCTDVMLGRGILSKPDLAKEIRAYLNNEEFVPLSWQQICNILYQYFLNTTPLYDAHNCGNRVKQWLVYLSRNFLEARELFENIKRKTQASEIAELLAREISEKEKASMEWQSTDWIQNKKLA